MAESVTKGGLPGLIHRLGAIGDRPDDLEIDRLRHRLLVYMGVLMSGGGILWGTMAASFGLLLPGIVPFGYVVLTFFNLSYFYLTKNFVRVRMVQVGISLLLPFAFQWTLGGFAGSGAVMLWAMLAVVGSLTFSTSRSTLNWLAVFLGLTVVSGVIDAMVFEAFGFESTAGVRTMFIVINIVIISSIVFGLTIYLLEQRERAVHALAGANQQITLLNERLEDDVAERTKELRLSLARTHAILDNMVDGLVAIGVDGRVQVTNPALAKLLDLDAELVGQPAETVLPGELAALAEQSTASEQVAKGELPLPQNRLGAATASPILTDEARRQNLGSVVMLRDVTLEREIDRMKTDFIATVSHELRTPLTSVLGFAKLTKNKLESSVLQHVPKDDRKAQRAVKQIRSNVDIIVSEGKRLTNLINDVLDISKMEAGRMEWDMGRVEPAKLVKRALEASAGLFEGDQVVLESDVEGGLPHITGDFDRLLQVILNLISNANKFTEEGRVVIGAKMVEEEVCFSVSDTGEGIKTSDLGSIFEKFKQVGDTLTSKPQGTGLGLPICKQIVHAHQGRLWVESKVGEGTTFLFVVSSKTPHVTTDTVDLEVLIERIEKHLGEELALPAGDILVVDDDVNLRELLRQQLTERGYRVRQAPDGYHAIEAVRSRRPDLIILDVMMPDISGFDVAAVLKSDPETKSIPIIILSIVQDSPRGYRLGVEKYLTKPMDADVLIEEIQRLLRRRQTHRRVLIVDDEMAVSHHLSEALLQMGYDVVGTCHADRCVERANRTQPDLIIIEARFAESETLIRSIRAERELEHVVVVQLMTDTDPEVTV